MKDSKIRISKIGISEGRGTGFTGKAKAVKMPAVSTAPVAETSVENPLGTKFTVFALAFNAFGLATLTVGGISIGGNALAADFVLGSSLVCLSAYLFRSLWGNRRKRI